MAGLGGTGGKSRAYSRVPRAVPEETGENRARIHGCERKAWDAVHTIQRLLTQMTNWVKLQFAAMNPKKLEKWKDPNDLTKSIYVSKPIASVSARWRSSPILCKPPLRCRIEASQWRFIL